MSRISAGVVVALTGMIAAVVGLVCSATISTSHWRRAAPVTVDHHILL